MTRGQRLSVGATSKSWTILLVLLTLFVLAPLIIFVVLVLLVPAGSVFLVLILPVTMGPVVLYRGLQDYRKAFWLDGPKLIQRRVRGYTEHDLRTARFGLYRSALTKGHGRPEPRLLVVHPPGRAAIRVPLGTVDDPLRPPPPHELEALIRAIAANHTDPNAPGIAHQLGQLSGTW